jgi:hypothetical protein
VSYRGPLGPPAGSTPPAGIRRRSAEARNTDQLSGDDGMMATMELSKTLAPYFRDGRLVVIPRRRAARLAVLDLLAGEFEPGHRYSEKAVNSMLSRYNPDFCTLRRYLVDEDFMAREDGDYWRVGGSVEVD